LFVCLMPNVSSALFGLFVPGIVEIKQIRHDVNDLNRQVVKNNLATEKFRHMNNVDVGTFDKHRQ